MVEVVDEEGVVEVVVVVVVVVVGLVVVVVVVALVVVVVAVGVPARAASLLALFSAAVAKSLVRPLVLVLVVCWAILGSAGEAKLSEMSGSSCRTKHSQPSGILKSSNIGGLDGLQGSKTRRVS